MGIVAEFSIDELHNELEEKYRRRVDAINYLLCYVGETAVKLARSNPMPNAFGDVTGNLRSSIGYVVLNDGIPVKTGIPLQYGGPQGDGGKGEAQWREVLDELIPKHSKGQVLLVIAGMNYASYVEEVHGKDVLSYSATEAGALAEELLKKLTSRW